MNTLQTNSVLPSKSSANIAETPAALAKRAPVDTQNVVSKSDRYSASVANDAVVAKVLSFSISKGVENSFSTDKNSQSHSLSDKFKMAQQQAPESFDIESVTNNVVNFVGKALTNLAMQGHGSEKLEFFKNQAIIGVDVGIDQAKIELIGIADEHIFKTIDDTRDLIIGGIKSLPSTKEDYLINVQNNHAVAAGTDPAFNQIEISDNNSKTVKIDFESNAFSELDSYSDSKNAFTTSASNISFSVQGDKAETNSRLIADLVNKVDGLVNSFYRGDVESSFNKAISLGYSKHELIGLASEMRKGESAQSTKTYGEIQHLNKAQDVKELTAPKAVADYLNRYLDVLETNKSALKDEQDFKQIINGLVNQMKDVQVPDLLQAINRFHSFNSQLR